ncbi:hypothetical protein ACO0QE_001799 [Hanseniaspora vineae]
MSDLAEDLINQFYAEEQKYISRIRYLQQNQEIVNSENLRLSENCGSLTVRLHDLEREISLVKNGNTEKVKVIEDLKQTALLRHESARAEIDFLKAQLFEMQGREPNLTDAQNALKGAIKDLESLETSLDEMKGEMGLLEKEKAVFEEEKGKFQGKVASLSSDLIAAKAREVTLLQKNAAFEKQTKELEAKFTKLQEKLDNAENTHKDCFKKEKDYKDKLKKLEKIRTTTLEQFNQKISEKDKNFEKEQTILKKKCANLEIKLEETELKVGEYEQEVAELIEQNKRLIACDKSKTVKLQDLEKKNRNLCGKLETKNKELADKLETNKELVKQVEESKKLVIQIEQNKELITRTEKKNRELASQVSELASRTKHFEEKLRQLKERELYVCKILKINYKLFSVFQFNTCSLLKRFAVFSDSNFKEISRSSVESGEGSDESGNSAVEKLILAVDESSDSYATRVERADATGEHFLLATENPPLPTQPSTQENTCSVIANEEFKTEKAIFTSNPFETIAET